MACIR